MSGPCGAYKNEKGYTNLVRPFFNITVSGQGFRCRFLDLPEGDPRYSLVEEDLEVGVETNGYGSFRQIISNKIETNGYGSYRQISNKIERDQRIWIIVVHDRDQQIWILQADYQ